MPSSAFQTPNKEDDRFIRDGDDHSCESSSPRSFIPLIMDSTSHDVIDNISLYSHDSSDNDDGHSSNVMERLAREIYTRALGGAAGQTLSANRNFDTEAFSDGDISVHSTKSDATASTESLSQNLIQSFLPLLSSGDIVDDEGAAHTEVFEHETTRQQQQQHTPSSCDLENIKVQAFEPVLVLGINIGHLSRRQQFIICATGVFGFNLLYGYLQELISVEIMGRNLGLYLAAMQFAGYTTFSYILNTYVYDRKQSKAISNSHTHASTNARPFGVNAVIAVPFMTYFALSMMRALDLGMTNLAMQYINYPAKTLMKSSRVVFTMIFGVLITGRKYLFTDYFVVMCMVAGLAIFMHADATSSAIFQPAGVIMLTVSLTCDGAISNISESIMRNHGVGQDEFIFRMYSIAFVAVTAAAAMKGDLQLGFEWISQPGTYDEWERGVTAEEATWSSAGKIGVIVLFSSMGFLGGSCSAAITKHFGALTMSITSTARKATTLFLSFFLFNNVCTTQHLVGVVIFITALTAKSLRTHKSKDKMRHSATLSLDRNESHDSEFQIKYQAPKLSPAPSRTVLSFTAENAGIGRAPPIYNRRQNTAKFM